MRYNYKNTKGGELFEKREKRTYRRRKAGTKGKYSGLAVYDIFCCRFYSGICIDGKYLSTKAADFSISSHNDADARAIHKLCLFKIKYNVLHRILQNHFICLLPKLCNTVMVYLLWHFDAKVILYNCYLGHILRNACCCLHSLLLTYSLPF